MSNCKLFCMEKPLFSKHCGYPCTKRSLWADVVLTRYCVSSSVGLAPLRTLVWSPNSWSSQDAASESSASASKSWRRLWFRILGSYCQDKKVGHPWSARTRTKQNKSCENRICANLALLVLWNRYLTLLAKNLSHTSPLGFCSSSTWCHRALELANTLSPVL